MEKYIVKYVRLYGKLIYGEGYVPCSLLPLILQRIYPSPPQKASLNLHCYPQLSIEPKLAYGLFSFLSSLGTLPSTPYNMYVHTLWVPGVQTYEGQSHGCRHISHLAKIADIFNKSAPKQA